MKKIPREEFIEKVKGEVQSKWAWIAWKALTELTLELNRLRCYMSPYVELQIDEQEITHYHAKIGES